MDVYRYKEYCYRSLATPSSQHWSISGLPWHCYDVLLPVVSWRRRELMSQVLYSVSLELTDGSGLFPRDCGHVPYALIVADRNADRANQEDPNSLGTTQTIHCLRDGCNGLMFNVSLYSRYALEIVHTLIHELGHVMTDADESNLTDGDHGKVWIENCKWLWETYSRRRPRMLHNLKIEEESEHLYMFTTSTYW